MEDKMKRIEILVILVMFGIFSVYAQTESWISVGYEHGSFLETVSSSGVTLKSTMTSPGIDLSVYNFYNNSNTGLFVHDSFLFPKSGSFSDGVDTINVDFSVYDYLVQIGLIVGPGFRYPIDEKLNLYYGIGISFLQTSGSIEDTSYYYVLLAYNIGVGGNIGLKYDFSEAMYFDVGVIANYDFKNYTLVSSTYIDSEGWADNYSMLSVRPYVAIGFNFYKENTGIGKPKK
jgi:hypothetical protein